VDIDALVRRTVKRVSRSILTHTTKSKRAILGETNGATWQTQTEWRNEVAARSHGPVELQRIAAGRAKSTPLLLFGLAQSAARKASLKPFDARQMRVYPVSSTVNSVKNDVPECAKESVAVQDGTAQSSLF
jgi:hypothetical protein